MTLALTFDDGPDPRGTPAVLEALAKRTSRRRSSCWPSGWSSTPSLLERVVLAGHDVQIHGYEHLRHPYTPREDVERDIDRALDVIPATTVADPVGAPRRVHAPRSRAERDLEIVGWDADTHDWRGDSAEEMLAHLRLEPGGIVLAHDGVGTGARRATALETARLVGPLVARARALGSIPARSESRGRSWSRSATRTSQRDAPRRDRGQRRGAGSSSLRSRRAAMAALDAARDPSHARRGMGAGPPRREGRRLGGPHLRGPPERRRAPQARRHRPRGPLARRLGRGPGAERRRACAHPRRRAARDEGLLLRRRRPHARARDRQGHARLRRPHNQRRGRQDLVPRRRDARVRIATACTSTARPSSSTLTPLTTEPYLSGDAIRTAAAWAGILDTAVEDALPRLKDGRPGRAGGGPDRDGTGDDRPLVRVRGARRRARRRWRFSSEKRSPTAGATMLDEAARAAGSRPFATGTALDRARRDFELFVLQHRLDPLVARLGQRADRSSATRLARGVVAVELLGLGLVPGGLA